MRFARRYKLAFSLLNEDSSVGNGDGSILHWNIDRLLQRQSFLPLQNRSYLLVDFWVQRC